MLSLCIVAAVLPVDLRADTLLLTTGVTMEGIYRGVQEDRIVFVSGDRTFRFQRSEVRDMLIHSGGFPMCYRLKRAPQDEECEFKLHSTRGDRMILVKGKKYRILYRDEIGQINVRRSSAGEAPPFLGRTGDSVKLEFSGKITKGQVTSVDPVRNVASLQADEGPIELDTSRVSTGTFTDPSFEKADATGDGAPTGFWFLLPGVAQHMQGRPVSGYGIQLGLSLALGAGASEYLAALGLRDRIQSDPLFQLYGLGSKKSEFDRRLATSSALGGLAALIYLYSAADGFLHSRPAAETGLGPRAPFDVALTWQSGESEEIYGVSLQLRF